MNHFTAYLFTQIDSLKNFSDFLLDILLIPSLVLFAVYIVCMIVLNVSDIQDNTKIDSENSMTSQFKKIITPLLKTPAKISVYAIPILLTISFFTPSQKQLAFIYIAPAIVNNKDIQKTLKSIPEISALGLQYLTETLKGEVKEIANNIKTNVNDTIHQQTQ